MQHTSWERQNEIQYSKELQNFYSISILPNVFQEYKLGVQIEEGDILGFSYDHVELNIFCNGKNLDTPVLGIKGTVFPVFYGNMQGGTGRWAVYYTGPTNYNVFFFVCLTTLGIILEFDWLAHYVECSNVSTTNCNVKKGKFCVLSLGMFINLLAIFLSFYISW